MVITVQPTRATNEICAELHRITRDGTVHRFPFDVTILPANGIYALFEAGEQSHNGDRVVRIGTHTGVRQLRSRLQQHFVKENKDRSIFRKNIGRCLLNRASDAFLTEWDLDLTTRRARDTAGVVHAERRRAVEIAVTEYMRKAFRFVVFRVEDPGERRRLESRMISTVSTCDECRPSADWLGRHSPKDRIRQSGLWLVNELYKAPLSSENLQVLEGCVM